MKNEMNIFCKYCTNNNIKEIYECEFRYCPFYQFRMADMDWQQIKQINEKNQRGFEKDAKVFIKATKDALIEMLSYRDKNEFKPKKLKFFYFRGKKIYYQAGLYG